MCQRMGDKSHEHLEISVSFSKDSQGLAMWDIQDISQSETQIASSCILCH